MDEAGSVTKFAYQNAFVNASINNKIITAKAKMQLNGRANFIADAKILLLDTAVFSYRLFRLLTNQ